MRNRRISMRDRVAQWIRPLAICIALSSLFVEANAQPQAYARRKAADGSMALGSEARTQPNARFNTPEPRIVPEGVTEITANGGAQFDNAKRMAVFVQDVVVADPKFTLYCDRLTVYLKAKENLPAKAKGKVADSPTTGGIDHALAEADRGKQVIIIQDKAEPDGKLTRSVGRGDRATFDSQSGNMVLTGNPSVQRGATFTVPAEPGTVITLNRNGDMLIKGATRTLLQDVEEVERPK